MIGATFCISCAERRLLSLQREHRRIDDDGQQNNGPAIIVNPVVVDISHADEQGLGDDAEPAKVHQGIERRIHGLEHVQVLGGDEQAEVQGLRARVPEAYGQRLGFVLFFALPIRRGPNFSRDSGLGIGRIGKKDAREESILKTGEDQGAGNILLRLIASCSAPSGKEAPKERGSQSHLPDLRILCRFVDGSFRERCRSGRQRLVPESARPRHLHGQVMLAIEDADARL